MKIGDIEVRSVTFKEGDSRPGGPGYVTALILAAVVLAAAYAFLKKKF